MDPGEASLFSVAAEDDRLLLDERPARALAAALGRDYTGLLGILIAAARTERITTRQAREMVDRLAAGDFRMSVALYQHVVAELHAIEADADR